MKVSNVYKWSDSPTYSITSSGASECHSDHDEDDDSDATFEGFEPLTEEDQEKLTKLGKLRTIEYGLKKREVSLMLHLSQRWVYLRCQVHTGTK